MSEVGNRQLECHQSCLVGHYIPGGFCIDDHPAIDEGWYFWNGCMFDRASRPVAWMPIPRKVPRG